MPSPMQLQQPREAAAHAIADEGGESGTSGAKEGRDEDQDATQGNRGGQQTKGHHHLPTTGRWSLSPLRSP